MISEVVTIRRNERSWAIELITKINQIARDNELAIKRAGGESTISTGKRKTMFPDVMLYGNDAQTVILQGWELKMPDVPIEDETFINDAQRKAVALNLNSCLIWNFTYATLYVRTEKNSFKKVKQWNDTSHIRTRPDVDTYRKDWESLLEKIVLEINGFFVSGDFKNANIGDIISNNTIAIMLQRNKEIIGEGLQQACVRDAVMSAYIDNWWINIRSEYEHDESNKFYAYAKTIIINWTNRIIFAHIIKHRQNAALKIDDLSYTSSPTEGNLIFQEITQRCDFYNVFASIQYNEAIPEFAWQDCIELSLFLKANGIDHLDQIALQNILEGSVNTTKRAINGQYTTPPILAKLLVKLTVRDWSDFVLDCCCGTGTIPKAALGIKKEILGISKAVETVWACDKYQYPLQVANISMTDPSTIHLANRIFQHNALTLQTGTLISITNPEDGSDMKLPLPIFGAVTSNLPFVAFELIPQDDMDAFGILPDRELLDGRSDLYCYITLKIADMIKSGGMLGIIISNSWLGTKTGFGFIAAVKSKFNFLQVHLSGKGRWFKNADVVTTILILKKKEEQQVDATQFFLWGKSLEELSIDDESERQLINSSLLGQELDPEVATVSTYSEELMESLLDMNVSYNALFHKVEWLLSVKTLLKPIEDVFFVFRGSRRGWDPLFYPKHGEHSIEQQFLKKVLINARKVTTLTITADSDAFCCSKTIEELRLENCCGALSWIEKFIDQKNGVGKPLPVVLKRANMQWYELQDNEVAEFFTMMNPDQRLFFGRFETPSFVNQRLIGLKHRPEYHDEDLNHALLNSMITMFYIEASGFGRGLGVLDINKDNISNCYMLDPHLVAPMDREDILETFSCIQSREIMKVSDELQDPTRIKFEKTVLKAFGLEEYFDLIKYSLLSLQCTRSAVKE